MKQIWKSVAMDHILVKLTCITLPLWIAFIISEPGPASCSELPYKAQKVDLYFPTPILEGDDLTMNCRFKLEPNASIYQVKWYKGSREIFRYQPKEFPPKKVIPLPTLIIDEPNFTTITKVGQLLVVAAPQERPSLKVEFNPPIRAVSKTGVATMMVQKNDTMTATCTSGASNPAVNITFYINNENYNMKTLGVLERKQDVISPENKTDQKIIIRSTLRLKLAFNHFVRHRIRVRCEASLFNLYNQTSDEYEAEMFRETLLQSSSYGGIYGRNGGAAIGRIVGCGGVRGSLCFGRFVWSITTIGAGQLVLLLVTFVTSWTL